MIDTWLNSIGGSIIREYMDEGLIFYLIFQPFGHVNKTEMGVPIVFELPKNWVAV